MISVYGCLSTYLCLGGNVPVILKELTKLPIKKHLGETFLINLFWSFGSYFASGLQTSDVVGYIDLTIVLFHFISILPFIPLLSGSFVFRLDLDHL